MCRRQHAVQMRTEAEGLVRASSTGKQHPLSSSGLVRWHWAKDRGAAAPGTEDASLYHCSHLPRAFAGEIWARCRHHSECKACDFCLTTAVCCHRKEFLIFISRVALKSLFFLGICWEFKISQESRLNINNYSFSFSNFQYLISSPGFQACPDGVHSLQEPTTCFEHPRCTWHHARHWASKNETPSLILYGFAGYWDASHGETNISV